MLPEVGAFLSALTLAPLLEETDFPFRPLCAGPDLVLFLVLMVFFLDDLTGPAMLERDGLLSVFELRTEPLPRFARALTAFLLGPLPALTAGLDFEALIGLAMLERVALLWLFELRTAPLPGLVRVALFVPEVSLGFTGLIAVAMLERTGLLLVVEVEREPLPRFARALTALLLVVLLTLAAGFGFAAFVGAAMLERVGLLLVIEVR